VLERDVEIPPRSQLDLPCKVVLKGRISDEPSEAQYWSTCPRSIGTGAYVAGTVTPDGCFTNVPVRAMNIRQQPCSVKAGTPLSDLEVLSAVEPVSDIDRPIETDTFVKSVSQSATPDVEVPEYVKKLVGAVDPTTPESAVQGLQQIILANRHVFSESETDLGRADVLEHRIDTGDARPIRQQLRRYPPAHVEAISDHVDTMLAEDVIEPATSPWASNIVLVRKKDGTYRCCIDYRRLNDVTIKDAYPLPKADQCLEAMSGAVWFSSMDMKSGYHQLTVQKSDRDKTSFICPRGMFRFKKLPFGLCNAGATFQRLMDLVMSGLHFDVCVVYLDDVMVYAGTPEEHLQRLAAVFDRLGRAGLKLRPEKCSFFQRSVRFLGHVVSSEGIATDPEKVKAVRDWPVPTSVTETRAFTGLASYYRRFVPNFAELASPLHALTQKNARFVWSDEAQEAFEKLKAALTSPPVLAMPRDEGEFVIDCDASEKTLGSMLSQVQDGTERMIAYASRSLDARERNYCCSRRELLAIVYFVKYWKQYVLGRKFRVRTDHSALTWLRRTPDPIGQQARWCEQLEEFDFVVEHRPGTKHGNADALSRRPCNKKRCACKETEPPLFGGPADTLRAAAIAAQNSDQSDQVSNTAVDTHGLPDSQPTSAVPPIDIWQPEALKKAQQSDPDVEYIYWKVLAGENKPTWNEVSAQSRNTKILWSYWPRLVVVEEVLYRRFVKEDGSDDHLQVVLP